MAKRIKAIKWPQCGSTDFSNNTQDGNYTCSTCYIVYGDVNIHIKVTHQNEAKRDPLK